jgi:poly(3-hydroxybutyrate) depolymerase
MNNRKVLFGGIIILGIALMLIYFVPNFNKRQEKNLKPLISRQDELEEKKTLKKVVPKTSKIQEIGVNEKTRTFIEQKTENLEQYSSLVVALHGNQSNGEMLQKNIKVNNSIQDEKMIVLYPNGENSTWYDNRFIEKPVDDMLFLQKLIENYQQKYSISPENTSIIGVSNGGFLAQDFLCNSPAKLVEKGIFVVSQLTIENAETCKSLPNSSTFVLGLKDDIVPYNGGEIQSETGGEVLSGEATFERVGRILECGEKSDVKEFRDKLEQTSLDCKNKGRLKLVSFLDLGHVSTALKVEIDEYLKVT